MTGRQTGQEHTFPVAYKQDGDTLTITVGSPEHKRWWRNLEAPGTPVQIRVRGTQKQDTPYRTAPKPQALK